MDCASCGRTNRHDARFCAGCGAVLAPRCSSCGNEVEPDAAFCDLCGTAVKPAAASAAAGAAPGAQARGADDARKVVTVVFADLAGSTTLHERMDPEAARELMERYYAAMREAVAAHAGTVVKLLGDGVMAAFGVPHVREDDALRAVRAAAAMQDGFRALADQVPDELVLRVGVNTGEVVVSAAHDDIVGDPVNVAARLQQAAADGEVLVSDATRRLVEDLVTLAPAGELTLKGRAETVHAHRLVALLPAATRRTAPFVGRETELSRLRAVYDDAVMSSEARLAVVIGSPGLGKSRLVTELSRELGEHAIVLAARCEQAGSSTFAPIAEALREAVDIDDTADVETVRAAIGALVTDDEADRERIVDLTAALVGAGTMASIEETFWGIRRVIAALARRRPVVLIIDDLHWAEPLLLDLTEHLVEWSKDVALLVLGTARPELRDLRASLTTTGGVVTDAIVLDGLDASAATRLAAEVLGTGELPAAVAGRVLAASEGNPLFLSAVVRMLVDDGSLERDGDRWVTTVDLADLDVPPTIQALLAARIERLHADERVVLERASVVGKQFSRAAVTHLVPRDVRRSLDAHFEALRRAELVEPDGTWFLGDPVFRFHHALVRDAAYRRLLRGSRAELHERFADWLEARAGDAVAEHDETLGWHREQAYLHRSELGPIDDHGRELGDRAAVHLAGAGRRALERDDLAAAESLLGRAAACLAAGDPDRGDLALDRCEALLTAGDVGATRDALTDLAVAAHGSPRLLAWLTCLEGQLAVLTEPSGLRDTAAAVADAAVALADLGDAAGEAKAHSVRALALASLGQVGECEKALDQALAAARSAGDRRRANAVLAGAPAAALWGPSPVTRASGRCLDVVRVLRITAGAPAVEAVALRCQAVLEALRGRGDAARRMIDSARRTVEDLGLTHRVLETEVFAGMVELLDGQPVAAESRLRDAYDGLRDQGLGVDAAQAAALLARSLLAQGRDAEAETLSHESEALAGDDLKAAIAWRGVRAEALARRGETDEAVDLARDAVVLAETTDALLDHADARMALASVLTVAGRGTDAAAEMARATALYEAKGATALVTPGGAVAEGAGHNEPERASATPTARRVADTKATRASVRGILAADGIESTAEPLASLGELLGLARVSWSFDSMATDDFAPAGAASGETIAVVTVDDEGRQRTVEMFPDDALGTALARLYERHAALLPDGPERTRAEQTALATSAFAGPIDEAHFRPMFTADAMFVDHRSAMMPGARGIDSLMEGSRVLFELIDHAWVRVDDVLGASCDALLLRWTIGGSAHDGGGPFELEYVQLWHFGPSGLCDRVERFNPDQVDAALARFDELVSGASTMVATLGHQRLVRDPLGSYRIGDERFGDDQLGPAVHRLYELAVEAAPDGPARERARHAAGVLAAIVSPPSLEGWDAALDVEYLDHRSGISPGARGPAALRESTRALLDLTDGAWSRVDEVLGASEDAVLIRWTIGGTARDGGGPFELEYLQMWVFGGGGRVGRAERFTPDQVDLARARFGGVSGEHGEPSSFSNAVNRAHERFAAAWAAGDPTAAAAVYSPDVLFDDRRTIVGGVRLVGEAFADMVHSTFASAPSRWTFQLVATRGDRLALLRTTLLFDLDGADAARDHIVVNEVDEQGQVARTTVFDSDDLDAAYDQLDAQFAVSEGAAFAETWALNRAAFQALNAGDVDAFVAMHADDFAFATHRSNGIWEYPSVGEYFAAIVPAAFGAHAVRIEHVPRISGEGSVLVFTYHFVADGSEPGLTFACIATHNGGLTRTTEMYELDQLDAALARFDELAGAASWPPPSSASRALDGVVVATRGDRLALLRVDTGLVLVEVDEHGVQLSTATYAFEDTDAAHEDLDDRYAGGEAAPCADMWEAVRSLVRALMANDAADAIRAITSRDFQVLSHRLYGAWSVMDLDEWAQVAKPANWGTEVVRIDEVLRLSPDVATWSAIYCESSDGGIEIQFICTGAQSGGVLTGMDLYGPEGCVEALARHDELLAAAGTAPFANAATRQVDALQAAWDALDMTGVEGVYSPAFRWSDRRPLIAAELDRDAVLEVARTFLASATRMRTTMIATRGHRLALYRFHFSGSAGDIGESEGESLHVTEVDVHGQIVHAVTFEPDDIDAAYDALDDLYATGEALPFAAELQHLRDGHAALSRGDVEALLGLSTEDLTIESHRDNGVWGYASPRAFFEQVSPAAFGMTAARMRHLLRLSSRAAVTTLTLTGADDAEITFITVIEYRAARSSRVDIYEVEQVDDALARFDALADAGESPFENAATRAVDRFVAAWPAHDWDGLVSLYSSDLRTRDHRAVIGGGLEMDHAEFIATLRWMFEGRQEWEHDVVATRGERLALVRFRHRYELEGSGPSDSTYLNIVELDERGLVVLSEQFELDDIDAAFEALDDRFAAGEAAPFADQLSALRSWGRSVNDRNSDAIVALCTEDYEHTSHRLTGAGSYATLRDYADSLHPAAFGAEALRLEHMLGVSATAFLAVGGWRGGTPAAEVVVEMVSVVTFDGARLAGQETYDVRQLDEAHARYDAIVADERATRSLLENAATRAATRWRALWHDGDWDGWVDAHAPDFEWEDRRPLVRMQLGRAPFIEMMQTAFERTVESHWTAATLATRGERLALLRMSHTWSGHRAGQSADEMLCVYEATEDGRVARVVEFTLDQLDEAYDELDDQYEAGEAARFPDAWSAMRGWVRTIDAGDSHATEALCTDDFEHISSRLASGWSYGTRREYFDILRPATLGLDRVRLDHVLRLSGGAIVAIGSWRGEDAGAEVEIPLLCVYELRGPLIRRMHVYDPHHLEVALAKYDDVVAAREPSMFDINRVDDALARYDQLRED